MASFLGTDKRGRAFTADSLGQYRRLQRPLFSPRGSGDIRTPRRVDDETTGGGVLGIDPDIVRDTVRSGIEEEQPGAILESLFGGGNRNYQRFLQNSLLRYLNQYYGGLYNDPSLLQDPNYTFANFLGGVDPRSEFQNLSPFERGENPSIFAPRVRFIQR